MSREGTEVELYSFFNLCATRGQRHALTALPPGMLRFPLYRRLGEPHGQSEQMRKNSPRPGFNPRTI
jgi:hypothetical protein